MWEELGISVGVAMVLLAVLYVVIRFAVKHGVKSAYYELHGQKPKPSKIAQSLQQALAQEKTKEEQDAPLE